MRNHPPFAGRESHRITAGLLVSVLAWTWSGAPLLGARERAAEAGAWKDCKYQNAAQCSRCHVQPGGPDLPPRNPDNKTPYSLQLVLMTEYAIWKTYDKHAQAYAVLKGPRGKMMGELLKQDVLAPATGCLNCHAMGSLAGQADEGGLDFKDGVSCTGSHGPSSKWLVEHAVPKWRKVPPEKKWELGMRDLRDPAVKAGLCMSCHIGNAADGKVVTHAMFAAGHPPLPPIEIATFAHNEPQHWRDARDVPLFKDPTPELARDFHLQDRGFQRTKLAVVGSVVALRETLRLAADRADPKASNPTARWPELGGARTAAGEDTAARVQSLWPEIAMAHSDCYSCHHDLRYPGFRQARGFGYFLPGQALLTVRPGRPIVRSWPLAPLSLAARYPGDGEALANLANRLQALAQACNERPFGSPETIGKTAGDLVAWADGLAKQLNDPEKTAYNTKTVLALMRNLCSLYTAPAREKPGAYRPMPDYETARQLASILTVAHEEWTRNGGKDQGARRLLDDLATRLNLQPYTRRKDRLQVVISIIAANAGRNVDQGAAAFARYLDNIADVESLRKMADDRDFLPAVRAITNEDFNAGILKEVDRLQKFSDEEETIVLRSIANYDPAAFVDVLREVEKQLPRE